MTPIIDICDLSKTFTLHNQGGTVLRVMEGATLQVAPGECVGLTGASGAGKSTLMRMIWGNYLAASGSLVVAGTDVARATPRDIIALRRERLGYVSQFLRVVPRVPTLDVVAEPLLAQGASEDTARAAARALLARLNIPERLTCDPTEAEFATLYALTDLDEALAIHDVDLSSTGADEVAAVARALFVAIVDARRDPPDAAQRHEAEQAALISADRIA